MAGDRDFEIRIPTYRCYTGITFRSCLQTTFCKQIPGSRRSCSQKARLNVRRGFSKTELIIIVVIIGLLLALLLPAIQRARDNARKTQSKNNLKQIGLGLYNYHDTHFGFPIGADVDTDGNAKHGLYTRSLPFFESSPLYSYFSFEVAWDHPINWGLSSNHLSNLAIPDAEPIREQGLELTHYATNGNLMYRNGRRNVNDLAGNASSVWMAGEVQGEYVPWAYPFQWRELTWPLNDGPASFGRPTQDGAMLLMADASVRFFDNEVAAGVLENLKAGSEVSSALKAVPSRPTKFLNFNGTRIATIMYGVNSDGDRSMRKGGGDFGKAARQFIESNPEIEGLAAINWIATRSDVELLASCKRLSYLRLEATEDDETLTRIRELPALKTLVVGQELIIGQE